jgi:hypothetical protein
MPDEEVLRWGIAATAATAAMWDQDGNLAISSRLVRLVRAAGALAELPLNLYSLGIATTWFGDFAGAGCARCGNGQRRSGHRQPFPAVYLAEAPVAPGQGSREFCLDSWGHPANCGFRRMDVSASRALGGFGLVQRPRPL